MKLFIHRFEFMSSNLLDDVETNTIFLLTWFLWIFSIFNTLKKMFHHIAKGMQFNIYSIMSKMYLIVCSVLLTLSVSAQQYKLVWEDNFDCKTLNETNNWNIVVDNKGGGNKELQYYRKRNVTVGEEPVSGNSCLIITAKKESFKNKKCTSGKITTKDKISFKYGKLEARMKLPNTADGLWPAFWMLGNDFLESGWPKCGEIDILEMGHKNGIISGNQNRYFNGACHWGVSWNNGSYPNKGVPSTSEYNLHEDFHLFTLIWDEDSIKMYLDVDKYPNNAPYFEMPLVLNSDVNSSANFFRKPFYIIFNLAVGGTFSELYNIKEITALNAGEAKMYIDFVRVYQKGDSDEVFSQTNARK